MRNINKVILIGRLGGDPEGKETKTGKSLAVFSLATSQRKKVKNDLLTEGEQWEDDTQWHKVVCWGNLSKICLDFFKKGQLAYVEGSIKTNKVEATNGEIKYFNEIIAENISLLEKKQTPSPAELYPPQ